MKRQRLVLSRISSLCVAAVGVAAVLGAAGCGDDGAAGVDAGTAADASAQTDGSPIPDAAAETPDAAPSQFAEHIITESCAPNDGPALRILLTDEVGEDCRPASEQAMYMELQVFTSAGDIDPPETVTWSQGELRGSGIYCPGGAAPCLLSNEGEVHFETLTDQVEASGTWRFDSGEDAMEGAFNADWCTPPEPITCG